MTEPITDFRLKTLEEMEHDLSELVKNHQMGPANYFRSMQEHKERLKEYNQ